MICKWNKRRGMPWLWATPLLIAGCGLAWNARGQDEPPAPTHPVLYTAARNIKGLAAGPQGRLWAATSGGVLYWASDEAAPRRWTTANGLDSNDVRAIRTDGKGLLVTTVLGQERIDSSGGIIPAHSAVCGDVRLTADGTQTWATTPAGLVRRGEGRCLGWPAGTGEAAIGNVTGIVANAQGVFLATSLGCWRWDAGRWHGLPLPPGSPASHVSALCADTRGVLAGLYGDGVYRWTSREGWQKLPNQPPACRFPTALAQTDGGLALGTQSEGVWRQRANGHWQACRLPPTLPSADINSLATFHDALWAGSFDGGLLRLTRGTAQAITRADGLSSDSPRGLAIFAGALFVRHADGQLDSSTDGAAWHPAFTKTDLPRPDVYALASDDRRLLLGGWAGWAATDGKTWERHEHDPELQGQVVTAIAAQGDAVWIGTQKRGLLRYENGKYTAYQEPQGLTDDWITCIGAHGDRLLVGTYTGGLLEKVGERFVVHLQPSTFAIRAIAFAPDDGAALAATPLGLYREDTPDHWTLIDARRSGGLETQAVLPCTAGVWVGTRTSLAFIPRHDL